MEQKQQPVKANRIHTLARDQALRDLREMYAAQYEILYRGYLDEYRKKFGYRDLRKEANRKKGAPTARDDQGRFIPKQEARP